MQHCGVDFSDLDRLAAPLDRAALVKRTPCGDGTMVWRGWGNGPPLLLLHGGSGSWLHWLRNIDYLSRTRTVWAADLPGFGDSSAAPRPTDIQALARFVAEGARSLIGEARGATLAGFSFGAMVAAQAALLLEDVLAQLVVVGLGVADRPNQDVIQRMKPWRGLDGADMVEVQRHNLATLMIADPARIDDVAVQMQIRNVLASRLRAREMDGHRWLVDGVERGRVPISAILGDRDATLSRPAAHHVDWLAERRPGAITRIIPDAGHWLAYEAAQRFNPLLIELLPSAAD